MHWDIPSHVSLDPLERLGFVYCISRDWPEPPYYYIGRKSIRHIRGKNRGSSNDKWKTYEGSCKELKEDIKKGRGIFQYEIIESYPDFQSLAYGESWTQMVLETPSDKKFYNRFVDRVRGKTMPITSFHRSWVEDFLANR